MSTTKEILALCRDGEIQRAYEIAKNDLSQAPDNKWAQISMAWTLYYSAKSVSQQRNFSKTLFSHWPRLANSPRRKSTSSQS